MVTAKQDVGDNVMSLGQSSGQHVRVYRLWKRQVVRRVLLLSIDFIKPNLKKDTMPNMWRCFDSNEPWVQRSLLQH